MSNPKRAHPTTRRSSKTVKKRSRSPFIVDDDDDDVIENEHLERTRSSARKKQKQAQRDDDAFVEPGEDVFIFQEEANTLMKALDKFNADSAVRNTEFEISPAAFENIINNLKKKKYSSVSSNREIIDCVLEETLKEANEMAIPRKGALQLQAALEQFQGVWNEFIDAVYKPMSPSSFASNWPLQQQGPAAIDCLRPPECIGLPISLLHPAFAKFISIVNEPIPFNDQVVTITKAAYKLCSTMSCEFRGDMTRLDALYDVVAPFLFETRVPRPTKTTFGSATPDGSMVMVNGSVPTVVEEKPEPGKSGDVYMQSARSFDAVARTRSAARQAGMGSAAFVLCIDGPNLLFSGGFKDGDRCVVEPLTQWCSMLPDTLEARQKLLAKHLYAFKVSLDLLINDEPLPGTTPKCPRIYSRFHTTEGTPIPLQFISPYTPPDSYCRLLFRAKARMSETSEEEVLVKVVGGNYGLPAHRLAAENGFAPKLYGVAELAGAPHAYVMEFLSKEKGWIPFRNASGYLKLPSQWDKLEAAAERLLSFLQTQHLVHGDLRPPNLLFRIQNDDIQLQVVDWDWSGSSFIARYPMYRNPDAKFLGDAGDYILMEHDRKTLMAYLKAVKLSPLLDNVRLD